MIKSLDDFQVYQLAIDLGEDVWKIVKDWNYFCKDTIGKQFIKAADSIAANLSEGLGRDHYKETKNFSYYSRGSLFETKTWITKAMNCSLITDIQYNDFVQRLESIGVKLNNYINTLGK